MKSRKKRPLAKRSETWPTFKQDYLKRAAKKFEKEDPQLLEVLKRLHKGHFPKASKGR